MPFSIPDIESLATEQPLLYNIFVQIQQAIASLPVGSSGAAPNPQINTNPATGLPVSGLSTVTNPGSQLTTAAVGAQENAMSMENSAVGLASSSYIYGGVWQQVFKIVRAGDYPNGGAAVRSQLPAGSVIHMGASTDNQGRPASSFFTNANDNTAAPTLTDSPLSNDGGDTGIAVAPTTWQFGGVQVSYNGGLVDPGVFGEHNVYFDDPQYNGGAVPYQVAPAGSGAVALAQRGRFFLGKITSASGTPHTGGTPGNGGIAGGDYVI